MEQHIRLESENTTFVSSPHELGLVNNKTTQLFDLEPATTSASASGQDLITTRNEDRQVLEQPEASVQPESGQAQAPDLVLKESQPQDRRRVHLKPGRISHRTGGVHLKPGGGYHSNPQICLHNAASMYDTNLGIWMIMFV